MILILSFLTIAYHMTKLMEVIKNNTSRTRPSSVSSGPLFLFCCLSDSMVCPIRALLVWADTRVGEEEDDT